MSAQHIANHLNELGVLPPNEYKRASGFNYTCGFRAGLNQKWTVVSVNRILKNESYTGTLIQGKRRKINYKIKKSQDVGTENWIRVEGTHDAIISRGEFQQVQQLMELDTRTSPSQKTVYPLSGFLRCADCGQNMIRRTVTKKGKKYQYYHCSTYKNGGDCTPHMINGEKLEGSVLAAIRHQVALLVEAEQVLSHANLASGEQIGVKILDGQINALEAELERYRNLKVRLYQDFCDDVVSKEEYSEMNARFAQKIKEAQDKIQAIQDKKQEAVKHDTMLPGWLEELKQYQHIKTLERRVVVELIDHIDIHSKEEIEIHFCFEDELLSHCYSGYYREQAVNSRVARAIKTVFTALEVVNQGMQEKKSITLQCVDVDDLKKQAEMIRAEQIKLYESYADGILTRNEYLEKKKGLGEKLADLQEKIRIEEEEQETADELDEEIRSLTKQASQKTYIGGLTKECVDAFVSMVYLYDDQTMKVEFNCEDVIRRALEKYGA